MTALEAYNYHKRATLDRLSLKYQLRMREVMRRELDRRASEIKQALDAGSHGFTPPIGHLKDEMHTVFEDHRSKVIHVGVSDGIQEISPDKKLSLWMNHDLRAPVEDTLTAALASTRDRLVPKIAKKVKDRKKESPSDSVKILSTNYLDSLKRTYLNLSYEWRQGHEGSTMRDVLKALAQTLQRSDYEAKRIFRTETTAYFNESRYDYFSDNTDADYVELFAVTDGRISRICETRHQFVVVMDRAGLEKYMPPFHPHCRTIQRPLISYLASHKRIIERGLAMSESSFAPLPENWA